MPPHASASTLTPDRRYLSVVVDVPASVDAAVRAWRGRHGPGAMAPPHVTVFMAEHLDEQDPVAALRVPALRTACEGFSGTELELQGSGSFRPVSPVSFLKVGRGADWLHRVHDACALVLPSASPFAYHPHLTLAHGLSEAAHDDAEAAFRDYRHAFRVERLSIFCGNLAGWDLLDTVELPAR